jgi:redox-sensitive bicupin YhaK (pirin superfamily)
LKVDDTVTFDLRPERVGWVQIARGTARLNGVELRPGDGVAIDTAGQVELIATDNAEVLLFDMGR